MVTPVQSESAIEALAGLLSEFRHGNIVARSAEEQGMRRHAGPLSARWNRRFPGFGPEALDERSAVIYTLPGSCRQHVINPFDYLKDLFTRLPIAKITQIEKFTPAAWASATVKDFLVFKEK